MHYEDDVTVHSCGVVLNDLAVSYDLSFEFCLALLALSFVGFNRPEKQGRRDFRRTLKWFEVRTLKQWCIYKCCGT